MPVEFISSPYSDPRQQLSLRFGQRSHWLQPWRAYEETPSWNRIKNALGIVFNVQHEYADETCRHLSEQGITHLRFEVGWGNFSYDDPNQLKNPEQLKSILSACRKYKIRPLILANGHHALPCPQIWWDATLTRPAKQNDTCVFLSEETVAKIVWGYKSGLSFLTEYMAPEILFTHKNTDGSIALSAPLPHDLPMGITSAATLLFSPFVDPQGYNPEDPYYTEAEKTLNGWTDYLLCLCSIARQYIGSENFDIEIWNEIGFGSKFLHLNNYFKEGVAAPRASSNVADDIILSRSIEAIKRQYPGVGVSDGFANQSPWRGVGNSPDKLTAISKHPYPPTFYAGIKQVPPANIPVGLDYKTVMVPDTTGMINYEGVSYKENFVPEYRVNFPEYGLTAIQTEHWIRDISIYNTTIGDVQHGRNSVNATPAPEFWITEINILPPPSEPSNPATFANSFNVCVAPTMTPQDIAQFKAKSALRFYLAYAAKGLVRVYLYCAKDDNPAGFGIIDNTFFEHIENTKELSNKPTNLISPALNAVGRMVKFTKGSTIKTPRSITVAKIKETHNNYTINGDPDDLVNYPPLYHRELLALFPFQCTDNTFVVVCYVMTRDICYIYKPETPETDTTRFDLPEEEYTVTLKGAKRSKNSRFEFTDPRTGNACDYKLVKTDTEDIVVALKVTDSPRLFKMRRV